MKAYTHDRWLVTYCSAKLRSKGVFAEAIGSLPPDPYYELWVRREGETFFVDLDAAAKGQVVKIDRYVPRNGPGSKKGA